MAAVSLSLFAGAGAQFFDNNGTPLSGGKIYTYFAGTTTPLVTYTTLSDSTFHTNPIVLDAAGRVPSGGEIWLQLGVGYKFVLKTSVEVLIATYDNIPSSAQPPAANDADSILYEQGYTVAAGSFIAGKIYRITSVGTTNFTLIGATSNTIGTHFIATGVGSGTGTAELSQTVETKLRESVSILDFGASTSASAAANTTAIQAALNSGAKTIFAPAGTYQFTTLTIPENVSLVGEGSTNTFFETATSAEAITFNGTYNTQLHGFTLNQTGAVQGKGLYLIDQYFVTMIDVTTNGFQYGLYALQAIYHYIRECKFEGGQYGIFYGGFGTVWNVDWFNNVLTFENCRFNTNTIIGSYVKGCEVVFIDCDWSVMNTAGAIGCKIEGVSASYNAHGIQIIQPYAESTDIVFSFNYAFVEINGGFVQGGTAAGASAATSIIDVTNNSTVFWKGRPRDSDYWDFGYRVTNTSTLTFDRGFTQSVRASNTVDGTSSVDYSVTEVTPGTTAAAVSSYNTSGLKRNYTNAVASVPTATPTTTSVLTNRVGTNVYMVSAVGFDGAATQEIGGQAFVTIYNDGTTKRASINSVAATRLTWSSIAADGTITFQHSATNPTTITFNATQLN